MRILGFDPGEKHTGWCLVSNGKPVQAGELGSWRLLRHLIEQARPQIVVAEDYRLYPSKAKAQSGSRLYPARTLGVIDYICMELDITFVLQMASRIRKDPLVKDLKVSSNRHENDAYRHAMAYWYRLKGTYSAPRDRS